METSWDRHVHDVCVCLYTLYYLYLFVGLSYYIYITILYTSKLHCVVYCVNVCCIVLFDSLHCYYFGKSRANDEPCFFGTRFQANRWKRWSSIKVESLKQLVVVDIRKKRGHRDSFLRVFTIWWPQESRFAILLLIWVGESRKCLYSCGGLAAKCTQKSHMHRWFALLRTAATMLREGEFLGVHPAKSLNIPAFGLWMFIICWYQQRFSHTFYIIPVPMIWRHASDRIISGW